MISGWQRNRIVLMHDLADDLLTSRRGQEALGNEVVGKGVNPVTLLADRILSRIAGHQAIEPEVMSAEGIDLILGEITPITVLLSQSHQQ